MFNFEKGGSFDILQSDKFVYGKGATMIKAVMFDLDGTLLPTNDDEFTKVYFGPLYKKASNYGYEKESFIKAILKGV